jgi:glycosyltransferase involved in cell wall biosynthesis
VAERFAGRRTHVLTTLSLQEKDTSIGLGLADPRRIHAVYNGIDLARFAPDEGRRSARRALWRLRGDDILLVAAGRLSPEKGHGDLLATAIRLQREHPRLKLAICGEGPLAAELARAGGRGTAPGAILLPGLVKDMPSVLAAADIFVHPALYEGFGLACLEAMAAGLPVVATRVGGLPELVRHGQDGFLVPPGDMDALAAALRLLVDSPGRRAWMGRKARLHAASFGRQRMLAAYHDLYRGAAGVAS